MSFFAWLTSTGLPICEQVCKHRFLSAAAHDPQSFRENGVRTFSQIGTLKRTVQTMLNENPSD